MITAERKPFEEILELIGDRRKIVLAGCGTCVTVCGAGGEREVEVLASQLKMHFKKKGEDIKIKEISPKRQCDIEFIEDIREYTEGADCILSMACGAGIQLAAEVYKDIPVLPAVNTEFIGAAEEAGTWIERCHGCGDCVLGLTGGICPIARCAKSLLNGPCGGSQNGLCEINPDVPCAWHLIVERLTERGMLDILQKIQPARNWWKDRSSGPRKIVREDMRK